jgi:Fe-S cluster assembly protein SufD
MEDDMTTTLEKTTNAAEYIAGFGDADFRELCGAEEPSLLRAKREEAFAAYGAMPNPTSRTEAWRRTNPDLYPFGQVTARPRVTCAPEAKPDAWDEQFDLVVSVTDDHYTVDDRAGLLDGGQVWVGTLAEAAASRPDLLEHRLQGEALPPSTSKFVALNQTFWNVGFCVEVAEGVEMEKGVLFRYAFRRDASVVVPRLLVVVGNGSQAKLAERYLSSDDATVISVASKEMYIGEGANLRMVTSHDWGERTYVMDHDMARVERDGRIDWITLNFGGKVSKLMFGSDVAGPGSSAELDGLFFAAADQHVDQTTLQIHSSPHTYSRLLYKGAVKDRGHSVYQGIIQAKPGAIDVDSYQTNNNLVLNDGAKADTIPGLLIDADDLKCSHGATIGNVDPEQVFYLRSRGLSEEEARRMLIVGYFEEIVDRIPFDFLKDRVHEHIEEKLAGRML